MTWLYRLALRAFPASHRHGYGAEMMDAFARARAERRGAAGLTFTLAACLDAVRAGLGERRRQTRRVPRGRPVLAYLGRDLAHAARALAKARGFSIVSILSLGIGLGVVIFMVLLFRLLVGTPPGFTSKGLVELVVIPQDSLRAQVNDWAIDTWAYPDFEEICAADTGMTLAGWTPEKAIVRAPNGAGLRLDTMYVSPNYFPLLGITLARGPGFTPGAIVFS